ncbi:MAG: SDR family oxidoreductase [Planctomycetes bacterium]|nr:SDR family oxidoreductase [Planctomycetota bacterium]
MSQLKKQVVLITGCSTGIGRALANEFARLGHPTFATARNRNALAGLEDCETLQLDVTDRDSIDNAVNEVIDRAGRIDVLVNNAGINVFGPLTEVPIDDVRQLLETNVTGLLAVTQAVFPFMAKQRRGRIVNIGSVVGIFPTPYTGAYSATKSAVHTMSDILRVEAAPFGIEVVTVQPGGVRSQIGNKGLVGLERYSQETSFYRKVYDRIVERANLSQQDPMETDQFARKIVKAVMRTNAPRVARAGNGATLLPILRWLPSGLIDRILAKRFGLAALND